MSRIGFIGLGIMGTPMAANLVKAGHEVAGHTRKQAAMDQLAAHGGRAAPAIADAVEGADFVVTMLPDWPQVDEVVLGPGGVFETVRGASSRAVRYIDFSTIRPETSREIARAGAQIGVPALDAPVSGGEAGAIAGKLSIMVGGEPEGHGYRDRRGPRRRRAAADDRPGRAAHRGGPRAGVRLPGPFRAAEGHRVAGRPE